MSLVAGGMIAAGVAALVAGLLCFRPRFRAAEGADKIIVLGPVLEAVAVAMFAAEHFLATRDLMLVVPRWIPEPLFWTYFVGACLAAAAISLIAWRYVHWSATLLALMFVIIVATIDLPQLPKSSHERFFWILTVRELAFASGALVLAGSEWGKRGRAAGILLMRIGRSFIGSVFVFYAIEHFLFPRNVPGVPLQKLTPEWMPAPILIAYLVGAALLIAGPALVVPRTFRIAATGSGMVLLALTVFFYVPILVTEIRTPLAVEGMNYVGDTLLFASTALLAGFDGSLKLD